LLNAYAAGELVGTMRLTFGADGWLSDPIPRVARGIDLQGSY